MSPGLHESRRWPTIGGHLALDLCNTVSWRLDPARLDDRLDAPAALTRWYRAVALHQEKIVDPDTRELERLRALRDACADIVDAAIAGESVPAKPQGLLASAWRDALVLAAPEPVLPWQWRIDADRAVPMSSRIALSIADLLQRNDLALLGRCGGPGCGWVFLDHTRNHSRRWCDPDDCGNRERVRAYARRQQAAKG